MKKTGVFERLEFSSYENIKKHRNDAGLSFYGPTGYLSLYSTKELRDEDYYVPEGYDKSDCGLYYEHYFNDYEFEHRAIENIELGEIYALRRVGA